MYKPNGYTSLAPYLIVSDAQIVVDFLKAVLSVEPVSVQRNADGSYQHIEILIDDTVLMIGQMPGATSQAHLHLYVPDVDATFDRARQAGGKVVQEPARRDDVDRRCGVADGSGTTWWFATQQEAR